MSDKTKFYRDQSHIRATTKIYKPPEPDHCDCGKTVFDGLKMWAVDMGMGKPVKVYCDGCLPDGE